MLAKSYYDLRSSLDDRGAVLTYCGLVSEKVLSALGETLKHKMAERQTAADVTKRVFSIFVEQVQNIIRYSDERLEPPSGAGTNGSGAGLVMVGTTGGQHFVICGNMVPTARAGQLKHRLDKLAGLSADELRQAYRDRLREGPEEESLGASIGLIEIVRRSSRPVEYDMHGVNAETSFFCLKAFV